MRKMILFAAFAGIAGFATACGGDACEQAADDITAKLEECGFEVEEGDGDGEEAECTDEAAELLECQAACYTDNSCDAINPANIVDDPETAEPFLNCIAECSGVDTGNGDTDDTDM